MKSVWLGIALAAAAGSAAATPAIGACSACPDAAEQAPAPYQEPIIAGPWQLSPQDWNQIAALFAAEKAGADEAPQGTAEKVRPQEAGAEPAKAPGERKAPQAGPAQAIAAAEPAAQPHPHLVEVKPYLASVRRWAREFELPESLILAVIHTESRFDPKARSGANAIGLMQLIPDRAGVDAWAFITGEKRVPTEAELLDPDTNIRLGAAYLRMLKDRYWSHVEDPAVLRALVLASYNWGIGNVRRRLSTADELAPAALQALIDRSAPKETSGYLRKVQQRVRTYEEILVASTEQLAVK
jgi:soluble lytic murein transglycosylase-like protein